jgi:hypothetical protein
MGSSSGIELRILFEGVAESTRWPQRLALFVGVDWFDVGEALTEDVDCNGRYDMSSMHTARQFFLATRPATLPVMLMHDPVLGTGVFCQRFPSGKKQTMENSALFESLEGSYTDV